eukprot:TRINITY_DN3127_c0_g1_i3.p1 TRINITY_DN3127_c0_g1~~TRINITY_DN3127_c0_g1_i3.p1  ORF type:complete len:612 (+),score=188.47 TRINITY_DN3127_c0_g1_i3:154-1989(+)
MVSKNRRDSLKKVALAKNAKDVAAKRELDKLNRFNEDEIDDEIDSFSKQKDKISFDSRHDAPEVDDQEESIYNLNLDEDDADLDEEDDELADDYIAPFDADDDELASEQNIDAKSDSWGKSKFAYYNQDEARDSEEEDLEEQEALSLQKKRLASLSKEDYEVEAPFSDRVKSKDKTPSKKSDAGALAALNKDLGDIDFGNGVVVQKIERNLDKLSKSQKLELLAKDSPELLELLDDFKAKIADIQENILPILTKVTGGSLETNKGISYLEVKYHLLLSYCTNICFYLLLKAEGKSVKDHPVIDQLVKLRTILEKIRPLDQKLKYQIDKLLKIAATGEIDMSDDPRRFKPNPDALVSREEDTEEKSENAVYKPPKLAETYFDEKTAASKERNRERQRQHAMNSRMMRELVSQFSDKPEEESAEGPLVGDSKEDYRELERIRFEEDNMIRLHMSKKDKARENQRLQQDKFKHLDDFSAIANAIRRDEDVEENGPASLLKKKSMKQIINEIDSASKGRRQSGDQDIPFARARIRGISRVESVVINSFSEAQESQGRSHDGRSSVSRRRRRRRGRRKAEKTEGQLGRTERRTRTEARNIAEYREQPRSDAVEVER